MNLNRYLFLLLGLLSRFLFLSNWPPYFYDEGELIEAGRSLQHGVWGTAALHPTIFPFLGPFISAIISYFSTSIDAQRIPYAIMGSLSVLVLYEIIKPYNKSLALLSAILLIISPALFINRTAETATGSELFFLLTIWVYEKYLTIPKAPLEKYHFREEHRTNHWWLYAGVCAGCAFLWNYIGLVAVAYLLFRFILTNRNLKTLQSFTITVIVTSSFFFVNAAFTGISNFFTQFFHYGASPSFTSSIVSTIYNFAYYFPIGQYEGQFSLRLSELYSVAGFIASLIFVLAYLVNRFYSEERQSNLAVAMIVSLASLSVVFFLATPLFFWAMYAVLTPFYSFTIAWTIVETLKPPKEGFSIKSVIQAIPVFLTFALIIILLFASTMGLWSFTVGSSNTDYPCAVSYLSSHQGMTAVNPDLMNNFPYNSTYYNYVGVLFYNHPFNYHEWFTGLPPSNVNLSLSRFRYFVIDQTLVSISNDSPTVLKYMSNISATWLLAATCGQYKVYQQPTKP